MYGKPLGTSYFGDYRWYSGYGGGAYCDVNSNVTFIDCQISGNLAQGGMSGQGGVIGTGGRLWDPLVPYEIPSFGGGAYCAAGATVTFTGCVIANNTSSPPVLADANFPNLGLRFRLDPYLGHGGGVCAEDTAKVVFNNCTFSGNRASEGGGVHWANANPAISDCNFTLNSAFQGGGLFGEHGPGTIIGCNITNNEAVPANDPNIYEEVLGAGGGIHCWATDVNIIDCNISSNQAETSGGGVYFGGENYSSLFNCLITDNLAGGDGGGVSANTYSDVNIANCTITGNAGGKFGGGLYCSYSSLTHIIDSIIWGNFAVNGPQIAIGSYSSYDPQPSVVEVAYSDIGPRYSMTAFGAEENAQASSLSVAQVVENQTIENEIQGSGWAKIVITLDEPTGLKRTTNWDSPASVAALQAEINNRQQAVLSTLTSQEFQLRYRCNNTTTFSGQITASGLNKLINNPQVKFIEPVRYYCPVMRQGLSLTNGMGIRPTYSGSGVAVAIVDTGVDYRHPKLGGGSFPNSKVIGGYDFGNNDADPIPGNSSNSAHGTCCAGIAAGDLANVGDYIGGVAYNAKIYALKASPDDNSTFAWDAVIASWDWCITHKNDNPAFPILAISNSLGGGLYNSKAEADAALPAGAAMVATAVEAGITVLAASGNNGATNALAVPAALSNVISVGAVYDTTDQVIGYSNTAAILDLLAPSDPTYTTDIIGAGGYAAGDYFPTFNGTSAACPFAAGAAAVLQSAARQKFGYYLTPEQVRIILTASGDPVTDTKAPITKPRVNLGAMIDLLLASPIYIEQGCSIEHNWWNAATNTWNPASHNLPVDSDPLFVEGYFLSQRIAGQDADSNCVDKGHTDASTAGMSGRHTTRTDLVADAPNSLVDLGYHYVRKTELVGDLNCDGIVDEADLALLISHWLDQCGFPDWCDGADLNRDGIVNFKDYAILGNNMSNSEKTPPVPNPMTWEAVPTSAPGATWAKMTATRAKDAYGGPIEYYIQRTDALGNPDGFYRDWDPNRSFTNTGLVLNQTYGYQVKARDARGNETDWSEIGYVTVGQVSLPSAPTNLVATAVSQTQINLTWTDNSSNETGFKIERKTGAGSYVEIKQVAANITSFNDTGLAAGTTYTYRVLAYNSGGDSPYSNEASATTQGGGGPSVEPNQPIMIHSNVDPNCTQTKEFDPNTGKTYWYHTVVATVSDIGGGQTVWFRFVCNTSSVFSSPWISSAGTFPMYLTHPVSSTYPMVRVNVNGTTVTYRIMVKQGGSSGWGMSWKVCASFNADGSNSSCSANLTIPWQ